MRSAAKAYTLLLTILTFSEVTTKAQVFKDTTLNYESPNGFVLKANSGTKAISIADYDLNGHLDIYYVVKEQGSNADASSWNRLFSFDGNQYNDHTSEAGSALKGITSVVSSQYDYKLGASWGDYNNDGYPDLFLANSGLDMLLKNNGDGTFTNITNQAGVAGRGTSVSSQGLWFDYDSDGDLDLYVSVQLDQNFEIDNKANRMYENLGNDEFRNVSFESGLRDSGFTWTSLPLDVNRDGYLDLYVANDFGPNTFYINNGDKTFSPKTTEYNLTDKANGMGLAIGDPNKDGLFDLYLTNITELDDQEINNNRLFINSGDTTFLKKEFEAKVNKAGWGWGTDFFDFDNDGDEDLIVANGYRTESGNQINRLFRNEFEQTGNLRFTNYTDSSGFFDPSDSFVNTVFDQNDDGFLDVFTSNTFQKPRFFLNTNTEGNWIKIWLDGVETNRNGFGSFIKIETAEDEYYRYHHGAGLHTQHILPIHVGLSDHDTIDKITVYWLNGQIDIIEQIDVNQTIRIREFEGIVTTASDQFSAPELTHFELKGNYPNPFNSETVITFELPVSSVIRIDIFDIMGRLIHSFSGRYPAGNNHFRWQPNRINTGLYFYRVITETGSSKTSKMLYIK
jgi:hypothetical protein